jgi:glycosyltransferase involved in cell wall biosynthesis
MANYWAENDRDITLITVDSASSDFYTINPKVKRVVLGLMTQSANLLAALRNNIIRLIELRKVIKCSNPDSVISFVDRTNVLTLLATRGLGLKVIVSERSDPAQHEVGRIWGWLRIISYPWAGVVVAQSDQVKNWLIEVVKGGDIVTIPNPIIFDKGEIAGPILSEITGADEQRRSIVAMGRLGFEKGFDMLIKAFSMAAQLNPEWRLVILGDGNERATLLKLVAKLAMSDRVFLPGLIKNPMNLLRQADIFVMSSRYEGFPNALLEAMACGLPVISFDCPSGPRHVIRDGIDGILVPPGDVAALAKAMNHLINDNAERTRLAARAPDVLERFGLVKIMGMWECALQKVVQDEH